MRQPCTVVCDRAGALAVFGPCFSAGQTGTNQRTKANPHPQRRLGAALGMGLGGGGLWFGKGNPA